MKLRKNILDPQRCQIEIQLRNPIRATQTITCLQHRIQSSRSKSNKNLTKEHKWDNILQLTKY